MGRSWGPPVAEHHYDGAFEFTGDLRVIELETDPTTQVWTPPPRVEHDLRSNLGSDSVVSGV